jgi:hypothetical protein
MMLAVGVYTILFDPLRIVLMAGAEAVAERLKAKGN